MGNNSIKSKKKKKKCFSCLCSSSSSSCSIDDKTLSTIDEILINEKSFELFNDFERCFSNTSFEFLIKKFQLNFYLKDYLNRLKASKISSTFKTYFSLSTIICPYNQILTDDFELFLIIPPESILPNYYSIKLHEQLRSKCYVIPLINYQIETNDNECQLSWKYILQTESIQINQNKLPKEFLSFCYFSSEDNSYYLSANLIDKWFYTFILVNQTCQIVKHFLNGNKTHITCLIKQEK